MKLKTTLLLLVAALALPGSGSLLAQRPEPRLTELSWLTGSWNGTRNSTQIEEQWTDPQGGMMLGVHREWRVGSERTSFEYLRIERREEGIFYVASPGGGPSTDFELVSLSSTKVVFANPEHDFPKRIVYQRDGEELKARVDGGEGSSEILEWQWQRVGGGEAGVLARLSQIDARLAGMEKRGSADSGRDIVQLLRRVEQRLTSLERDLRDLKRRVDRLR